MTLLAPLAACSPPGLGVYDKPGLTYAEWRRDDAECRQTTLVAGEWREPERDLYARCMRARGYHLRSQRP